MDYSGESRNFMLFGEARGRGVDVDVQLAAGYWKPSEVVVAYIFLCG